MPSAVTAGTVEREQLVERDDGQLGDELLRARGRRGRRGCRGRTQRACSRSARPRSGVGASTAAARWPSAAATARSLPGSTSSSLSASRSPARTSARAAGGRPSRSSSARRERRRPRLGDARLLEQLARRGARRSARADGRAALRPPRGAAPAARGRCAAGTAPPPRPRGLRPRRPAPPPPARARAGAPRALVELGARSATTRATAPLRVGGPRRRARRDRSSRSRLAGRRSPWRASRPARPQSPGARAGAGASRPRSRGRGRARPAARRARASAPRGGGAA